MGWEKGKYQYDPMDKYRKRIKRERLRNKINEVKMSNFCQRCRLEDPDYPSIFDFDHQSHKDKEHNVSNMIGQCKPWPMIFQEICKCRILCANCHRKKSIDEREDIKVFKTVVHNDKQGELF